MAAGNQRNGETKSERRAARYSHRAIQLGPCAGLLWCYRARCAARYRVGPNFLRGKSRLDLVIL